MLKADFNIVKSLTAGKAGGRASPEMKPGSVLVAIVNRNGGPLLRKCIAHIAAQTRRPECVVVVDNGSSDDSLSGITELGIPVEIVWQDNKGFAQANNLAVRSAEQCGWIATLNPDAFPEADWLEALDAPAILIYLFETSQAENHHGNSQGILVRSLPSGAIAQGIPVRGRGSADSPARRGRYSRTCPHRLGLARRAHGSG
jgi:glycosyltransferase involved in cell wall biosynthesis